MLGYYALFINGEGVFIGTKRECILKSFSYGGKCDIEYIY